VSEENLEIVRAMAAAFNAGDYESVLDLLSPDIEYHELRGMPGAGEGVGVYRGRDELVRWFTEFLGEWEPGFQSQYVKVKEVDDTHVMTVEHWRGRGARSGIDADMTAVALHTVVEGRITRMRYFRTEAEALEAAGVSPRPESTA
jgi:ketosteroid isomerase-like protein